MDRRAFIQSLPCLGAGTALPTYAFAGGTRPTVSVEKVAQPAKSTPLSEPRIGVIAVGGAGGTILSELYGKLPYLSHLIAIDVDLGALQRVAATRKILIGDAAVRPRDARTVSLLANDARTQIADAVAGLDIAFIVAGMGGVAGTAISPIVAEMLRKNQAMTIAAAFTPVNSEGLHERAGSHDVLHLHGRLDSPFCFACRRPAAYPAEIPDETECGRYVEPPRCSCGGRIRPGVVWFGEMLPEIEWNAAMDSARRCDVFSSVRRTLSKRSNSSPAR